MRPLRLELTAFGPFAQTQAVDFRELGPRRLFLVHGPTGAGKTTLLDAICFALYGDATGAERDGKGFRSQFAGPEQLTRVTLDFALGSRIYRITRQPEQERAKRRGEGTTVSAAAATLWDRSEAGEEGGEGRVLATGASRVSEAAAGLLGFRSEQFRQVIVLPQGRFRALLLASSREREEILRQLFDTAFYGRVEEALRRRGRELKAEAEKLHTQRGTLLAQAECANEAAVESLLTRLESEAGGVQSRIENLKARNSAASQALERAHTAHARLEKLVQAEQALALLCARREATEAERRRLATARRAAGLADRAQWFQQLHASAAATRAEHARLKADNARVSKACQAAALKLSAEQARESERKALRDRLGGLEGVLPVVKELAGLLSRRAAISAAVESAMIQVEQARQSVTEMRKETVVIRHRREAGSAALLAQVLRPGEPCPVCGAVEHPKKAGGSEEIPSRDALAAAEQGLAAAERALDAALASRHEAERSLLGLDADLAAVKKRLGAFVVPSDDSLREVQQQLADVRAELGTAERALDRALEDERDAREQRVRIATAFESVTVQHAQAGQVLQRAQAEWRQRLDLAGFADDAAFQDSCMPEDELARREGAVAQYDRALVTAQTVAVEARAAVADDAPPDVASAEAAAQGAAEDYRSAVEECGRLASRAEALRRLLERLGEIGAAYAGTEARFGIVGTIANVAGGDNPHRMSLQRFVLASRLDDVLAAASRRLGLMSRGRYLLRRNIETTDRRSAGGLELEVEDALTGGARPVSTLSGGESFQAALALALGLSEVVQAYAGGIRLDTIFIDEGFGSLDPEALDLAIDVLLDLQQSGRMVGVISHVPELRERIDVRLEVLADAGGSRVNFRLP
jgi:DNA repair protein SbcC/Rad50